jgi:hypothetical protein
MIGGEDMWVDIYLVKFLMTVCVQCEINFAGELTSLMTSNYFVRPTSNTGWVISIAGIGRLETRDQSKRPVGEISPRCIWWTIFFHPKTRKTFRIISNIYVLCGLLQNSNRFCVSLQSLQRSTTYNALKLQYQSWYEFLPRTAALSHMKNKQYNGIIMQTFPNKFDNGFNRQHWHSHNTTLPDFWKVNFTDSENLFYL